MKKIAVEAVGGNQDDIAEDSDDLRPPMLVQGMSTKRGVFQLLSG